MVQVKFTCEAWIRVDARVMINEFNLTSRAVFDQALNVLNFRVLIDELFL